ncbi:MAG: hypothetical protein ACRDU8_05410, partial [Egibacteraceae bacterium]
MREHLPPMAPQATTFRNPPRVPPGWIALVVGLPVIGVVTILLTRSGPPAPNAWGWIAAFFLAVAVVSGLAVIPQSWGAVEVDRRGLSVRGRLVVPASQIGDVVVLTGVDACRASWFRRWAGRTVPARQNLYGGAYGWGRGVVVGHLPR